MPKTATQQRQDRERAIVRGLIRHLKKNGWTVDRVYDGGDEDVITGTETEALEAVFAVDDSTLWFKNAAGKDHGVYLVCGNDGDIISDYNYSEGDADAFCKLMEEYGDRIG